MDFNFKAMVVVATRKRAKTVANALLDIEHPFCLLSPTCATQGGNNFEFHVKLHTIPSLRKFMTDKEMGTLSISREKGCVSAV